MRDIFRCYDDIGHKSTGWVVRFLMETSVAVPYAVGVADIPRADEHVMEYTSTLLAHAPYAIKRMRKLSVPDAFPSSLGTSSQALSYTEKGLVSTVCACVNRTIKHGFRIVASKLYSLTVPLTLYNCPPASTLCNNPERSRIILLPTCRSSGESRRHRARVPPGIFSTFD